MVALKHVTLRPCHMRTGIEFWRHTIAPGSRSPHADAPPVLMPPGDECE